jgi:proteasome lid subunit RPN8/RPN11
MRRVWLTPEAAESIARHAKAAFPHECCGVLLGDAAGDVREVVAVENVSPTPETAFVMDAAGLARVLGGLGRRGRVLVGFYHSHPRTPAIPSGRDIAEAHYPDAVQVIVSLRGQAPEVMAWRIAAGAVERVPLLIQASRPEDDRQTEPDRLTRQQRIVTVLGGVVAALLVIGVALSLLPPPPVIQ